MFSTLLLAWQSYFSHLKWKRSRMGRSLAWRFSWSNPWMDIVGLGGDPPPCEYPYWLIHWLIDLRHKFPLVYPATSRHVKGKMTIQLAVPIAQTIIKLKSFMVQDSGTGAPVMCRHFGQEVIQQYLRKPEVFRFMASSSLWETCISLNPQQAWQHVSAAYSHGSLEAMPCLDPERALLHSSATLRISHLREVEWWHSHILQASITPFWSFTPAEVGDLFWLKPVTVSYSAWQNRHLPACQMVAATCEDVKFLSPVTNLPL